VSRLAGLFARAREEKRAALIIYLTADDPDGETSQRLMLEAAAAGADIIEVGIPWSDPSADGKVIQAAAHRARARGGGMRRSLALCRSLREANPDVGLVLFGYYPPDEDRELPTALARHELDFIPLLAPTSTPARVEVAVNVARGFIYYVSLTGITGTALVDLEGPRKQVAAIKARAGDKLPVAVGFGIRTPGAARSVATFADGVVVGAAAVDVVEKAVTAGRDPVPELGAFVRSLRGALGPG
jgi:tryptophan synthase alpha chain